VDEISRHQAVLRQIEHHGKVTVVELAEHFEVSSVTIRKVLHVLEERGRIRRVRGGAVSITPVDEGAFEVRLALAKESKESIARHAASLVSSGDTIVLDASTTCYYLARELLAVQNLVVITNGLPAGMLLMEQSTAMVIMPGGVLRRAAGSVVGTTGLELAGRGTIDHGFFGAGGVSVTHGLMDVTTEEATAKRHLAMSCHRIHGLFDASKEGRKAVHPFVPINRITSLWTDASYPVHGVRAWGERGVAVHRAPDG